MRASSVFEFISIHKIVCSGVGKVCLCALCRLFKHSKACLDFYVKRKCVFVLTEFNVCLFFTFFIDHLLSYKYVHKVNGKVNGMCEGLRKLYINCLHTLTRGELCVRFTVLFLCVHFPTYVFHLLLADYGPPDGRVIFLKIVWARGDLWVASDKVITALTTYLDNPFA